MEILTEGQYFGKNLKKVNEDVFKLTLTRYTNDTIIENHYHTNNYLSILTSGSYIEKNHTDSLRINAGDILFRPCGYSHQNTFRTRFSVCFNIEFTDNWSQKLGVNLKLPRHFSKYASTSIPSFYKAIINFQCNSHDDITSEFIYDWLYHINQKTLACSRLPCVEKASAILENELDHYHTLTNIAERLNVHPVYLARAFKEKKGLSIGEYQLKFKLDNSVSLLLNSSQSISSISFANGFYDDSHFIRSFKELFKISPHQFRLRLKS